MVASVVLVILVSATEVREGTMCHSACAEGWECREWVDPLGYSPTFSSCEPLG